MNVTYITPTWFHETSAIGGGERYVDALAKHMAQRVNTRVISFGPKRRSFTQARVAYEIFKYSDFGAFDKHNPAALTFLAHCQSADIIHTHQICTFVADLSCLFANAIGKPIVGTDHGGGGIWVLNRKLPVYRLYNRVIGQSQVACHALQADFAKRQIAPIPGGIDLKQFCPASTPSKDNSILFVGRLLPHKGVDLLIEAFKLWKQTTYRLKIIGRPANDDYLQELYQSARGHPVEFIHEASDDDVICAYQQANATILPSQFKKKASLSELMGFTILESQACGTPVVTTDTGPMQEFLHLGKTGLTFADGNPKALAKALAKITSWSEHDPQQVLKNCRQFVQPFSWYKVTEKHLDLYLSL